MALFSINSDSEPLRAVGRLIASLVAGAVALTTALLQLANAFGADFDGGQQAALIAVVATLVGIVGPLVGAEVGRDKVFSTNSVNNLLEQKADPPVSPPDNIPPGNAG